MGSVAYIHDGGAEYPRPVCVRDGDVIKRVIFNDDLPYGFRAGGFVYILINCNLTCGLYVINTGEGLTLVRLEPQDNGLRVQVCALHASFSSFECKPADLYVAGRVTELFPTGHPSFRLLCYEEGIEFRPTELPFLTPKFQR